MRALTEPMDTATLHGELLFHLFGALAQYERALTQERIRAGLAAARRRGRRGGRPRVRDVERLEAVRAALGRGESTAAVCWTFGIPRSTLYDALGRGVEGRKDDINLGAFQAQHQAACPELSPLASVSSTAG